MRCGCVSVKLLSPTDPREGSSNIYMQIHHQVAPKCRPYRPPSHTTNQSQNQTGTAQSIPVLSRAYRYCPGVSSSRHHHQADTLSILDVLAKTPCLYLIPELRYPCHYYRHRCRCPLPRRHPSHLRHHHHHHLGSWGNTKQKSSRKPHVSI